MVHKTNHRRCKNSSHKTTGWSIMPSRYRTCFNIRLASTRHLPCSKVFQDCSEVKPTALIYSSPSMTLLRCHWANYLGQMLSLCWLSMLNLVFGGLFYIWS